MGRNSLLLSNKEFYICTSKAARWLTAFVVCTLLLQTPPAIHAQSTNEVNQNPDCEINLTNNQAGVFCVSSKVNFVVGDSNQTILEKKLAEERAKAIAKAKLASASTNSSSSVDVVKLYRDTGQCVPFARAISGVQISGAAISNKINSKAPESGAVVITTESKAGHAAVVTAVTSNFIEVIERNYFSGWVSKRKILLSSPIIRGYITHS